MAQVSAYLVFEGGKCREGMEFYKSCLGGKLDVSIVGESEAAQQFPAELQKSVLHSVLENEQIRIFASDNLGGDPVGHGMAVRMCVTGTSDEVIGIFNKLVVGGKVGHKPEKVFFGTYGDLVDKYGMGWMVQADPE